MLKVNPLFNRAYRLLAYKICNRIVRFFYPLYSEWFERTRPLMRQSKLYMTLEEYVSTAIFTLLIFFPFIVLLFYTAFTVLYELSFLVSLILSIFFGLITSLVSLGIFYIYPTYRIDRIKRNIEANLPYATTHMATISGTGVPTYSIFRLVSEFKEYGEIAREFGKISRDIEVFGSDTLTAISQSAAETPSPHLKELLWGIVSLTRSGGDLRTFLVQKAEAFMEHQKILEKQYMDSLSLLAEMYTTIFVAGPILFVVMITIMGSMGSLGIPLETIMVLAVYVLMPVLSVGFMLLVEGAKPTGVR